ncbi:MAG: beta-phosphoglucomutase family hydrolase [Planctomycetota bacterium]
MNAQDFEKYDGLIFDCDGTLADSMPLHFVAWRETLARYGIDFDEARFYSMGGMPSSSIVQILSSEQGKPVDALAVAVEKEQHFQSLLDRVEPKTAVVELAQTFAGRKPMAVASGSGREVVMRQLEVLGIANLFSAIVTAEDTQKHKPEPDVFLEAARQLNLSPTRCVVFEDSPLGFQAATAAGMDWIDVR